MPIDVEQARRLAAALRRFFDSTGRVEITSEGDGRVRVEGLPTDKRCDFTGTADSVRGAVEDLIAALNTARKATS